jgi:hypothetical protein
VAPARSLASVPSATRARATTVYFTTSKPPPAEMAVTPERKPVDGQLVTERAQALTGVSVDVGVVLPPHGVVALIPNPPEELSPQVTTVPVAAKGGLTRAMLFPPEPADTAVAPPR